MPEIKTLNRVSQGTVRIIVHTDGIPRGGHVGDLLAKKSDANFDTEWITPANAAEEDNTKPITSAAVYTEIGNINVLLAAI